MSQYYSSSSKMSFKNDGNSDNDDSDPGREVIEKNIRHRFQRIADHTKEELNTVLKRVDKTLHNYEDSVQSSLIQHGMTHADMSNVEQVADLKELENLLNDSLAKQRYKQRLMVFIVGHTEQATEKAKLLQQIEQFFNEQKQSFSGREFAPTDDINEGPSETDIALKSFNVKDCFIHVKALGTRLNELNEEIIQYLILNAGTKQQAKGKKKLAQVAKETKEQLTSLQSKLETANNEMINKDNKIETLEKEIETIRNEIKTNEENQKNLQDDFNQSKTEIKTYEKQIKELENNLKEYQEQIDDLTKTITDMQQSKIEHEKTEETNNQSPDTILPNQTDEEQIHLILDTTAETLTIEKIDKEVQTSDEISHDNNQQILSNNTEDQQIHSDNIEDQPDLNLLFNSTELIDVNDVPTEHLPTAFTNLRKFAVIRIRELLKEVDKNNETIQKIKQEYDEYKITCEKEQIAWTEKSDDAYELQIKAQKTAEETINHLESFMKEQENIKPNLVHQETQTDEPDIVQDITPSLEHPSPIEEPSNDNLSSHSKIELESIEHFRKSSLNEKYSSLIEEKKHELDQLKQQADIILSRPSSIRERIALQSLENSTDFIKPRPSFSSRDSSADKELEPITKQDQQQQTSLISSRRSSIHKEESITYIDQFKLPFFNLYEMIYKFRHSIINLLEQNKFLSLAECLQMIKQLSSDDNNLTNDFVENSERVLKDIIKVLQTCLSTINEKEKEVIKELEPIIETPLIDNQQSLLLQQKDTIINELKTKYENLSNVFNSINTKLEEESKQNESLIRDQQKLTQNLQQELSRLQKRLAKIESDGIVEPSIMFTRLDAERNDRTLQQAVSKGKLPETTYNELNETMEDYVRLPSQQLSNLVKRYIQFRKVSELEDRIQSEVLDNETKTTLEKIELLHGRRADQIGERMSNIRRQRANLARTLTEKFDDLENESSVFLIRPVYSYQGRIAVQSYMKNANRRREELLKEEAIKKKHHPSRQSFQGQSVNTQQNVNQKILPPLSSVSSSDDDDRLFHIDKSFSSPRSSPTGQQADYNTDSKQDPIKLNEITRLQELDIQRALMPVSHSSTTLLSTFTNNSVDPCVPSLNLRSYVALSRPGIGNIRLGKPNEILNPVSRENISSLSVKSQGTNPRTPYNSSAGDLRRTSPPLPPIKRSINLSISPAINEKQHIGFFTLVGTNEN